MTTDVTINTALNQQANTQASSTGLAEDFSQFLQLLTIQLQNQDPLSPMETNEFTNQLVAFTGVEQQINTNQKLDSLVSLGLGNSLSSAIGYVGLDVSYLSAEFAYEERDVNINYALTEQATESTIRIYNEKQELVFETDGSRDVGNTEYVWNGLDNEGNQVPAGTYEVVVDAINPEGNAIPISTVVEGRVRGVETQNGLTYLLVGERAISIGNVLNVNLPDEEPVDEPSDLTDLIDGTGDDTDA